MNTAVPSNSDSAVIPAAKQPHRLPRAAQVENVAIPCSAARPPRRTRSESHKTPLILTRFSAFILAVLCAPVAIAGPTFEPGHSFEVGPYPPSGKLVEGTDGNFYGTTSGRGSVFKMTPAGVLTTLVKFTDNGATNKGSEPMAGLVEASDGNFYGTTAGGGTSGHGTVFKMTPAGVLTTLVNFTGNGASNKGGNPKAGLVEGSDGNFYGMTFEGGTGTSNYGTVFKMTPAGVLTTLVDFTGNGATNKGSSPQAGLVEGSDGNFYGTTLGGGGLDLGTMFKMTPAGILTTLMSFKGPKGYFPAGALVQGSDGNFYGTTSEGGTGGTFGYAYGTVFKMTPAGVLTTLVNFTDGVTNMGATPQAALIQGSDGNFYGTTREGGTCDQGTIFKMTPAGALTTLKNMVPCPKGREPLAGLVQSSDGNLYGTASWGGTHNDGTVFKMTPTGVMTMLVSFTGNGDINKGDYPLAELVEGRDGNLYGTTYQGGTSGYGTVFKMTPAGVLTTLVNFAGNDSATNTGHQPIGPLVQGRDGNFYGTTSSAIWGGGGTVFRMTPAGVLTTLVNFTGNNGSSPGAGLVEGRDGNFYGTTYNGGTSGGGTIFKMTPAGVLTTLVNFPNDTTGYPAAGLLLASDGNFYGTTSGGLYVAGDIGGGTIFKMTPTGALTTLVTFSGEGETNNGVYPIAGLVEGRDGNFYGTTWDGGAYGSLVWERGTVFKMTPAGVLTTVVNFDGTNGASPSGTLAKGIDGNLYGTTERGGAAGIGTVFRLRFGPTPVTKPPTAITSTTATLNGTVNPNGLATTVSFQIGTAPSFAGAKTLADTTLPAGTTTKAVSLSVTGLSPNTRYYVRVVARNAGNTIPQHGATVNFTTLP